MTRSRQHRFARPLLRNRLRYLVVGLLSMVLLSIGSAMAWADETEITLDFVRHAQSQDNVDGIIGTTPPGADITDPTGTDEAVAVGTTLSAGDPVYAGIYTSDLIRTQQTADPQLLDPSITGGLIADLQAEGQTYTLQPLAGLDEINAGWYEGNSDTISSILYGLPPLEWVLGFEFTPIPGSTEWNGIEFDETMSAAVQTIYDNTISPSNTSGSLTDVAFSHQGAISIWALMNVKNPDFDVIFNEVINNGGLLPNTGIVQVTGDPTDGWTLVSWDGTAVPTDAGLLTDLFVDARDLFMAPQTAAYNIGVAILSGDPTTMLTALQTGVGDVATATLQFPLEMTRDFIDAFGGTDLMSTAATDVAGLGLGDFGTIISEALTPP